MVRFVIKPQPPSIVGNRRRAHTRRILFGLLGLPGLLLPGFQLSESPRMAAGYHYGVKLRITPTGLSPASAAASLAALPRPALPGVFGRTGLSATLAARSCPSRGSGWCVHTTDRASRVATSSLFHTCRRHYPGGNGPVHLSLLFPVRHRPSP